MHRLQTNEQSNTMQTVGISTYMKPFALWHKRWSHLHYDRKHDAMRQNYPVAYFRNNDLDIGWLRNERNGVWQNVAHPPLSLTFEGFMQNYFNYPIYITSYNSFAPIPWLLSYITRAWCKTIVTPYIKWGSYNSFAPIPWLLSYISQKSDSLFTLHPVGVIALLECFGEQIIILLYTKMT